METGCMKQHPEYSTIQRTEKMRTVDAYGLKASLDSRVLNEIRKTQKHFVSKLLSPRVYVFVLRCMVSDSWGGQTWGQQCQVRL